MSSGAPADDDEVAVARVNAMRASRGLPPIVERDSDEVRAGVRRVNAAARALLSALRGSDAGVAAAFDAYEAECDPVGLPAAVACAATVMAPLGAGSAVGVAVDAAVATWRGSGEAGTALQPGEAPDVAVRRIRGGIERAVWHISRAATTALPDGGLGLAERLDGWLSTHAWVSPADVHYEDRLRRAASLMLLGRMIADAVMCALAHELARRENRCRPWLPIAHVFHRAAFLADRHGANPPAGAVIADLRAELALLEAVPYLPDETNDEP